MNKKKEIRILQEKVGRLEWRCMYLENIDLLILDELCLRIVSETTRMKLESTVLHPGKQ